MKRGAKLKPRSKKMEARYAGDDENEGRRALVRRLLEVDVDGVARAECRARIIDVCTGTAHDVHEILARSGGGSILDEANCIPVCRSCHGFIGDNPRKARALGLRRSQHAGRNPKAKEPDDV